jgi:hypothetical protein
MEQQRLFAWSEISGLIDLDAKNPAKVLESNTFMLHRTTVLDLLIQVQCLFEEFRKHQEKNKNLATTRGQDEVLERPEEDAKAANFPLPTRRRDFIKKAMRPLIHAAKEGGQRLRWASFDKDAFETLLLKFSQLNDSMMGILDAKMQNEIHHAVQDTNRGVLQLHHKIADLRRLVMALNVKLEQQAAVQISAMSKARATNADGLKQLSNLAKFKAFNESIESEAHVPLDKSVVKCLELGEPKDSRNLLLDTSMIKEIEESDSPRCEAILKDSTGKERRVWIEWKEYDVQGPSDENPPKAVIFERVGKLAALLNHSPKPDAFRTPHCIGFFDKAGQDPDDSDDEDILNRRLGLVFERPKDDRLHQTLPPVSLWELLQDRRKPTVTERVQLAHAVSKCVLYLHAVNWLHKGLRSHNVIFFRTDGHHVDYSKPYLSGFDFSRPARPDEMTDIPADDVEHNLYRHPQVQSANANERSRFKKSFDIYSLGVLFVELAHWKTIDAVLGIDLNRARGKPSVALGIRKSLLDPRRLGEIGACMGKIFEDATGACITGGEELGNDSAEQQMMFHDKVVKKLGEVNI